jgi:hypothetical protein
MNIILACAVGMVLVIGALTMALCWSASPKTTAERRSEDDEQMEYLCEWNAIRAIEREIFDKAV